MKKMLILALSLISFSSLGSYQGNEQIYARLLISKNIQEIKLAAKSLHHDLPVNTELWDLAAFTLWTTLNNQDTDDQEVEDTASWLVKAIGESKMGRYSQLLEDIGKLKPSKKLARYIKQATKNLNNSDIPQFIANEYDGNKATEQQIISPSAVVPTQEQFDKIALGASLDSVVRVLGDPSGVGQYIHSRIRPFIGRQTFQNLRLAYTNLGSMEFSYAKDIWVLNTKSAQGEADISVVNGQFRDLLSRLISNDPIQIRAAAKEAIKMPLADAEVLDHVAQYIWDNKDIEDEQMADALAWLCKVISASNNGRYKHYLDTLLATGGNKKIMKYAAYASGLLTQQAPDFMPATTLAPQHSVRNDAEGKAF